jgi:hypothetical protein
MIERTVLEIAQHRFWAWQRKTAATPRNQLRETDQLLGVIEECRVRRITLIPSHIWRRVIQLLGQLDGRYAEKLGIDRSVDRTSEVLFEAQEALMLAARAARRPSASNVIPLFREQPE